MGILLNNAVKFTGTGGSFEISTNVKRNDVLEISVQIQYRDSLEYQEKIFENSFRWIVLYTETMKEQVLD
jgi:hypothetical protein